ncbi:hypothetical protein HWV62_16480 [Athelia sp. TMB]|nr:hypothetical protein HWV62_16480 [Athelia sp. TMB]
MPWQMAERAKTHRRWSEKNAGIINHAATLSMKLWENTEIVATHAFLVWLNVEEYVESDKEEKILFSRTVRDAKCVPMDQVHAMYDSTFAIMQPSARDGSISGYQALETAFAHRPGLLRITTIDECPFGVRTPFFNMMPVDFDKKSFEAMRDQMPLDGDWLKLFKARIAAEGTAWKPPVRQAALQGWIDKQQSHLITASLHALNLRKQPKRIETDVLVVLLNCREEVVSAVRRLSNFTHSVHKAYAVPIGELNERYAGALEILSGTPHLKPGQCFVRILVVDDNPDDDDQLVILAPNHGAIASGRVMPSFDPEWLSIFKENTRT